VRRRWWGPAGTAGVVGHSYFGGGGGSGVVGICGGVVDRGDEAWLGFGADLAECGLRGRCGGFWRIECLVLVELWIFSILGAYWWA